jgi:hypothetical protein
MALTRDWEQLRLLWHESCRPSVAWLRRAVRSGAIPHLRAGRFYFFDLDTVRDFVTKKALPSLPSPEDKPHASKKRNTR